MYKEILKLRDMLEVAGIPFEFQELYDGYSIKYPSYAKCIYSVVEHRFSHGSEYDTMEVMECDNGDVTGGWQASEIFEVIKEQYKE